MIDNAVGENVQPLKTLDRSTIRLDAKQRVAGKATPARDH